MNADAPRSTSSSTIAALLPPSSSDTRFSRSVASEPTRRPAAVDPVNDTLSTPGWVTRDSLTARSAGSTDSTPSGSPASGTPAPGHRPPQPQGVDRCLRCGLEDHRAAGEQCRHQLVDGNEERDFP